MLSLYVHNVPAVDYSALRIAESSKDGQRWKTYNLPGLRLVLFPASVTPDPRVMWSDPPQECYQDAQLKDVKRVVEGASVDADSSRVVDDVCDWGYLDHE